MNLCVGYAGYGSRAKLTPNPRRLLQPGRWFLYLVCYPDPVASRYPVDAFLASFAARRLVGILSFFSLFAQPLDTLDNRVLSHLERLQFLDLNVEILFHQLDKVLICCSFFFSRNNVVKIATLSARQPLAAYSSPNRLIDVESYG